MHTLEILFILPAHYSVEYIHFTAQCTVQFTLYYTAYNKVYGVPNIVQYGAHCTAQCTVWSTLYCTVYSTVYSLVHSVQWKCNLLSQSPLYLLHCWLNSGTIKNINLIKLS